MKMYAYPSLAQTKFKLLLNHLDYRHDFQII